MFTYKIVPKTNNMSVRTQPNTSNTSIGQLTRGVAGYGNNLTTLPNGDKWLYVEEGGVFNNTPVAGWVAIIHLGVEYCTLETLNAPPPVPPPSNTDLIALTVVGEVTTENKLRVIIQNPNNLPIEYVKVNDVTYSKN